MSQFYPTAVFPSDPRERPQSKTTWKQDTWNVANAGEENLDKNLSRVF